MITEDAKHKFSASLLLGAAAAKHVSHILASGPSVIFLAMKTVQLVIFPLNQPAQAYVVVII